MRRERPGSPASAGAVTHGSFFRAMIASLCLAHAACAGVSSRGDNMPLSPKPARSDDDALLSPDASFSAVDSRAASLVLPRPRCLSDVGGCPFEPARLPPCPAGVSGVPVDPVDPARAVGHRVALRGVLHARTMTTLVACSSGCCNAVGGPLVLLPEAARDADSPPEGLELVDDRQPEGLRCQGDESRICCALPEGATVVAEGTVRVRGRRFVLDRPFLCIPPNAL